MCKDGWKVTLFLLLLRIMYDVFKGGEGDDIQGGQDQGNKPVRQNYYRGFRPRFVYLSKCNASMI